MSGNQLFEAALHRACQGQPAAMDFLRHWSRYVHGIDDLIDEPTSHEFRIGLFAWALELYNHPFYLQHRERINPIILMATNAYADSVAWEQSPDAWKRQFSDWARHCGAEMVLCVAGIVGGYAHLREISLELRTVNYQEHHDEKGIPT